MSLGTNNKRPRTLEIIQGYSIKFQHTPFQMGPPPLRNFSEGEMAAIDKEIVDLLKKGAIEVCSHTPGEFISNIFTVPKKSSGNRPIIDMRALNQFVEYIPFRMEDISLRNSVLKQGDFMTKLDLGDAYLTVPVNKRSRIYLCFIWCTLPIHLPPFRSLFLRHNFHQGYETNDCISKGHGDQITNFSG